MSSKAQLVTVYIFLTFVDKTYYPSIFSIRFMRENIL